MLRGALSPEIELLVTKNKNTNKTALLMNSYIILNLIVYLSGRP